MGSRINLVLIHLLGIASLLLLAIAMLAFTSPRLRADDDFGVFWVSARLHQMGRNPYDPDAVNAALPSIGHREVEEAAAIIRYAPYVLPILLPFAVLPYPLARAIWFLVSLSAVIFCAQWLWALYGGPAARRWLSWVLVLTFLPVLSMLQKGQVGWWVLLGLLSWTYGARWNNQIMMGAGLFLIATKPHLVYLVVVTMFLWIVQARAWRTLVIFGVGIAIGMVIAMALNPSILQQYAYAMVAYPTFSWATPTVGSYLRLAFGVERAWLQFLPMIFGLIWLAFHWKSRRAAWRWEKEIPHLITVSLITTMYGWSLDWVLLSWPILQIGARLAKTPSSLRWWLAATMYAGINGLALAIRQQQFGDLWLGWMPWAILLMQVWLQHSPAASEVSTFSGGRIR